MPLILLYTADAVFVKKNLCKQRGCLLVGCHHDDVRSLEVKLRDILVQLQQEKQWQYQNEAQSQTQSDRTIFKNNGNPDITIKNEANAIAIAAIILAIFIG